MIKFNSRILFAFLIFNGIILSSKILAQEETCDKDGECDEESENLWTLDVEEDHDADESDATSRRGKSIAADDIIMEHLKDNGISLKRTELALLLNYLDQGDDGRVDKDDLQALQKLLGDTMGIVQSVAESFNRLDKDDDGRLTKDELPSSDQDDNDDGNGEEIVDVSQYLEIISKLEESIAKALEPFKGLGYLSPFEVKTIVSRSVMVFKDKDKDGSGGLSMEEYLKEMEDRPEHGKAQKMTLEQKKTFFGMIDKDSDGEISYQEFQEVIPKGPPTMPTALDVEQLFNKADKDEDGYWTKDEFADHLRNMVAKTEGKEPQETDIQEAFNQLDQDKDGKISKNEMLQIHKQIETMQSEKAVQGFKEMDTDGNGVLTRDELISMAEAMKEKAGQDVDVDTLLKMLDKDGNGLVELEEVKDMVQRMGPQPPR